jgi:di/tripeptidase
MLWTISAVPVDDGMDVSLAHSGTGCSFVASKCFAVKSDIVLGFERYHSTDEAVIR